MTQRAIEINRAALKPMMDHPHWIAWRAGKPDPKTLKFRKTPINIHTGNSATGEHKTGDYLKNCGTFEQAISSLQKFNLTGVGFVVNEKDPVVAVDIDDCIEDRTITAEAQEIIDQAKSYTEISPSGTGIRIFVLGKLPPGALNNPRNNPCEIYDSGKFLTVTGNVWEKPRKVVENQVFIDWFCKNKTGFRGVGNNKEKFQAAVKNVLDGVAEGQRDDALYRYACRLRGKNMSREEAETLVLTAARACLPPFPDREAIRKIDQAWKYEPGGVEAMPEEKPQVSIVRASDLTPEPIQWIWPGWLAAGKVHIFAGAAGIGKTRVTGAIGSTITMGGRFPDGYNSAVADIAIWSGEDDPSDTLLPRLIADGAELKKVHIIRAVIEAGEKRSFDPSKDIPTLEPVLAEHPIRLLIVDPVVSAVAGDSHKNAEVRRALQPLVDLAERYKCAVVGVTHFSKNTRSRDPLERVTGSIAFGALARMVWAAVRLPDDDENKGARLFVRLKSNIGLDGGGFKYFLQETRLEKYPEIVTTSLSWGEAIEGTPKALFDMAEADDENRTATDDAVKWLRDILILGPKPVKEIMSQARQAGFTPKVLRRAREKLKIETNKLDWKDGWEWRLPEDALKMFQHPGRASSQETNTQNIDNINYLRRCPEDALGTFEDAQDAPVVSGASSPNGGTFDVFDEVNEVII